MDKYIGESARLIREMFGYAKEHQPCIIFMDEIDAIGGRRFSEGTSADREIQRTLMELLSQLDGFDVIGKVGRRKGQLLMGSSLCCPDRPVLRTRQASWVMLVSYEGVGQLLLVGVWHGSSGAASVEVKPLSCFTAGAQLQAPLHCHPIRVWALPAGQNDYGHQQT